MQDSEKESVRESKVTTVAEAVERFIPEKSESIWVGGMHMHNVPMALVRECIRQGKKFDTLYAGPSASISAELMMGAGLIDRVVVGYIGYEHLGIAQVFRRLARSELCKMQVEEVDSASMVVGLN